MVSAVVDISPLRKNSVPMKEINRFVQSFFYKNLPQEEHEGYKSESGKIFKMSVFRSETKNDILKIDFRSLNDQNEQKVAKAFLKNLKIANIDLHVELKINSDEIMDEKPFEGYVCAYVKNPLTGRRIFLEPGDGRHTSLIEKNLIEKYETLFKRRYTDSLEIKPIRQETKFRQIHYKTGVYIAWSALYEISGSPEIVKLAYKTGIGSAVMKGFGFLEQVYNPGAQNG